MPSTSPSPNFMKRFLGSKPKDIELSNQSGKKDKRLRTKMDDIKEGYKIFKNLGKKN